jgi:hypothetical protein
MEMFTLKEATQNHSINEEGDRKVFKKERNKT